MIGNTPLQFAHQKSQHTTINDRFAAVVVQAILARGKNSITDEDRRKIATVAKDRDFTSVVKTTKRVTSWVHDEILKIARLMEPQK